MATRSTIKIEGVDFAKIYKHWDGYPSAMTEWLNEFNNKFNKLRNSHPEYKFAQLLRYSQKHGERHELDMNEITGWGVVPFDNDYNECYEYILTDSGVKTIKL